MLPSLDYFENHEPMMPALLGPRARVLLVEADEDLRGVISGQLLRDGFHVYQAVSTAEVRAWFPVLVGQDAVDLLVFDVSGRGGDRSAITVVRELREAGCRLPVLFLSALPDAVVSESATELAAFVLSKPFSLEGLAETALDVIDGARVRTPLS